uniref:Uncharacterized protein n=1 Tax=Candidatus Kentrum sp. SD TaxID=2126332 RepID=A0A451BTD3_9GAMM|nr:MAG: hypothetical protein BECKSD772D_GA0070982_14131 [Candidatus Kentron sp. SD]
MMTRLVQQTAQIVARSSHNLALFVIPFPNSENQIISIQNVWNK